MESQSEMKGFNLMKKYLLILAAGILTAMIFSSCAAPSYNVEVYVSKQFKEQMKIYPSLEVDIVGVTENEAERFDSCNVDEYFEIGNTLRTSTMRSTLYFSETNYLPKVLKKQDPVWKKFDRKGAVKLYLLVNMPLEPTKGAVRDIRKTVMNLERPGLFESSNLYFEITPAGINQLKERPQSYPVPVNINHEEEN